MALLRVHATFDDDGDYDSLMEGLMALGGYDIEDEEIQEQAKPHTESRPKKEGH